MAVVFLEVTVSDSTKAVNADFPRYFAQRETVWRSY